LHPSSMEVHWLSLARCCKVGSTEAPTQECARRRAFKSIKNNPNYTEKELEKALDEVFDTCYRDPAPFAMPP
jgi:hypothetical protein